MLILYNPEKNVQIKHDGDVFQLEIGRNEIQQVNILQVK